MTQDSKRLLNDFIEMSLYAGERFDITQAGGGNSSAKTGRGAMLVKASGYSMSDVDENSGYVEVDLEKIIHAMDGAASQNLDRAALDRAASANLSTACLSAAGRPSIETFLHAIVGRFALHTHPLSVNAETFSEDWLPVLRDVCPDAVFVESLSAGISLGIDIRRKLAAGNFDVSRPLVVFLRSHGLIVSADSSAEVIALTESLTLNVEKRLGLDYSRYRSVTPLSEYLRAPGGRRKTTMLVCDDFINRTARENEDAFFIPPLSPDMMVFNGEAPLKITDLDDTSELDEYIKKYGSRPTVILHGGNVYISAPNMRKAKEYESALKGQLEIVAASKKPLRPLSRADIDYLKIWDAEKHRREN